MSLDNSAVVPALPTGGYQIDQSLRFNDNDSAYLTRTPSSSGSGTTWTWSAWIKRGNLTADFRCLMSAHSNNAGDLNKLVAIFLTSGEQLDFVTYTSGAEDGRVRSNALLRDVGSWYHIMAVSDTTNSTANDRLRIYINGERVTSLSVNNTATQNYQNNMCLAGGSSQVVGRYRYTNSNYYDGYMAEVYLVDGQALDPSYFGETDEDYGHWKPIKYTGSYGTNGFYLPFEEGASGLYEQDRSGNGNNFTAVNMTQAVDVVLDSPTNNFCTLNPLGSGNLVTLAEGNLEVIDNNSNNTDSLATSTFHFNTGKYYWEQVVVRTGSDIAHTGITDVTNYDAINFSSHIGYRSDQWSIDLLNGNKRNNNSYISYGSSFANLDIVMCAVDMDAGKVWWGKNGTWFASGNPASGTNAAFTNVSGTITPGFSARDGTVFNFGQDSSFAGNKTAQGNTDSNSIGDFYYTPPSGFLALCTANLPDPAVIPSEHFNTVIYSGTGASLSRSVTGVGFQPDVVWQNRRSTNANQFIFDAVRGVGSNKDLIPNGDWSEGGANGTGQFGYISSFDSDGFSTTPGTVNNDIYNNTYDFVTWNWKANGSGSSNTNGTITSTVSANQDAGFSIVTYTGSGGSTNTVGHGLSKPPQAILVKGRNLTEHWCCYIEGAGASYKLRLNSTIARSSDNVWQNTAPTSSKFYVASTGNPENNGSGKTYVAYCFHSVDGYSKVGEYIGNGSSNGTFVYTGFRPAFVMCRRYDAAAGWHMFDNERPNPYNVIDKRLEADNNDLENSTSGLGLDILSNGFKFRGSFDNINGSGNHSFYIAFAEHPFKYTNAR